MVGMASNGLIIERRRRKKKKRRRRDVVGSERLRVKEGRSEGKDRRSTKKYDCRNFRS